ncbi:MAG: ferrous iron transport protein A [Anaerolineae bacterium]|nr:ferrous iron transport protein A [Anaerolineae bacterium]
MVPLTDLSPGNTALVRGLHGGRCFMGRMAALGFTPGASIQMVRNYGFGPVIVSLRGTQVALGRREAHHVLVHPMEGRNGKISGR